MIFGATQKLKFQNLKRRLRLPFWQVVGVLESLWLVTYSNAPDGDIGRLTDEEIAAALEWDGNAAHLIEALVESRWVDRVPAPYRLLIHDWHIHCSNSHKGNQKKYGRKFAIESLQKAPREPPSEPPSEPPREPPSDGPSYPILTKPNPSSPILDDGDLSSSWERAGSRLRALGAVRWEEAINKAKSGGCTPEHVLEILDFAAKHNQQVAAVVYRVKLARMDLRVADGWPGESFNGGADQSKRATAIKKAAAVAAANDIIRAGLRAGKSDAETNAELSAAGLERPE